MPNQNTQADSISSDDSSNNGGVYSLDSDVSEAGAQVRQTEDASLQDDSYAFDEDNTDNEEYHDAGDADDGASDLTDIFESDDDLQ